MYELAGGYLSEKSEGRGVLQASSAADKIQTELD